MGLGTTRLLGGVFLLFALAACSSGGGTPPPNRDAGPDAGPSDAGPPLPPLPVGLLVTSRGSNVVLRYDGAGMPQGVFASDSLLVKPVGITFGPDGSVYVAVGDSDRVMRFDGESGGSMGVFTSGTTLESPRNVNFGPDGAFYVADGFLNQVLRFDGSTGVFDAIFISDPALQGPTSFTFGPDGNVYVVSVLSNKVLKFDGTTGALIGAFASEMLKEPHDVSFGPDGNLYVTNSGSTFIQRYHGDTGQFLDSFVHDPALSTPLGMAWGPDGNLYVANQGGNEIRRYDGVSGAPLPTFVTGGAGGLDGPAFLAFFPPAALTLEEVTDVAGTWAAVVLSGAQPGARVLLVTGTPGGTSTLPNCPTLEVPLSAAAVSSSRIADESGSAVVSVQGTRGSTQSWVGMDTARCVATPVTTVTVP